MIPGSGVKAESSCAACVSFCGDANLSRYPVAIDVRAAYGSRRFPDLWDKRLYFELKNQRTNFTLCIPVCV